MSNKISGDSTSSIFLAAHPRFRDFPVHSHDFVEFMYVASGKITHILGEQRINLFRGDIIIFGKNTRHCLLSADREDIGINIIVSADLFGSLVANLRESSRMPELLFEPLLSDTENLFRIFHTAEDILIENLMENMITSMFERQKPESFILRQSLLLLMSYLSNISDAKREISDYEDYTEITKRKVMDYIRTSYNSATLTEAAQMLGLSPPYLSRWIKKHFGITFKDLLTEQRFRIAIRLLDTSMRISEIIEKVGYENSSYFHKEFRKRYGNTPANFRKGRNLK